MHRGMMILLVHHICLDETLSNLIFLVRVIFRALNLLYFIWQQLQLPTHTPTGVRIEGTLVLRDSDSEDHSTEAPGETSYHRFYITEVFSKRPHACKSHLPHIQAR